MKKILLSFLLPLLASCGAYDTAFLHEELIKDYATEADTTECVSIVRFTGASVHAAWTGTPTATIYVQATNLGEENAEDISGASVATGGTTGSHLFNISGLNSESLCVFFDYTSGSMSLDVTVTAKGGST